MFFQKLLTFTGRFTLPILSFSVADEKHYNFMLYRPLRKTSMTDFSIEKTLYT